MRTAEEVITEQVLISAYDLHYGLISGSLSFPSVVFLDSGGYEISKDVELSDLGQNPVRPRGWRMEYYHRVLRKWKHRCPTVLVSYDHPRRRHSVKEQIDRALETFSKHPRFVRELLIKPESKETDYISTDAVIAEVPRLAKFNVLGVTEKELGPSFLERMKNIARIRTALEEAGQSTPIHIFGSLDPVSSPLYMLSGADIFDGLTWLRLSYHEGFAIYKHNYGCLRFSIKTEDSFVAGRALFQNYYYLEHLTLQLRRFLKTREFSEFKFHGEFFREAYATLWEDLGG